MGIALLLSSFRFEDLAMRRTFCILLLFTGLFLPSGLARTWTHGTCPFLHSQRRHLRFPAFTQDPGNEYRQEPSTPFCWLPSHLHQFPQLFRFWSLCLGDNTR